MISAALKFIELVDIIDTKRCKDFLFSKRIPQRIAININNHVLFVIVL